MNTEKFILVVCDPYIKRYEDLNYQLLGKARELSYNHDLKVLCLYWGVDKQYAIQLVYYGADKVKYCKSDTFGCSIEESYDYSTFLKVTRLILEEYQPELVLFTGTAFGKAIAAMLATSMKAGLVADCIDIVYKEKGSYIFSRAALSSSIIANIICTDDSIQMCTIKPNVFVKKVHFDEHRKGCVEEVQYTVTGNFSDIISVLNRRVSEDNKPSKLEKSKIVFGIGRGVSDEDFEEIKKLASYFKADIGGTRIMVEKGKLPKSNQIGQSGISIAPEVYIAFGISGANQHITGIMNAKIVIAINNDPKAAIFEYADYGIISDVHEVIEEWRLI